MQSPSGLLRNTLFVLLAGAAAMPSCVKSQSDAGGDAAHVDAGDDGAQQEVVAIDFSIGETFTIADSMGHLAFPDVAKMADGRLILVYRQGAGHVESTGRIMKQFADADAASWSSPEVLFDEPGVDDRDPSVVRLSDGRLLLSYFQYFPKAVATGTVVLHQIFSLTSDNNGATFSAPYNVSGGPMDVTTAEINGDDLWADGSGNLITVHACSSPAVEIDGVVRIARYGGYTLNLGNLANTPRSRISFFMSSDVATVWTEQSILPDEWPTVWVQEPALRRLRDGTLVLHIRTAAGTSPSSAGKLAQSTSLDGGTTWAPWRELSIIGHAPYLYQLENGVLLSAVRQLNSTMSHAWTSFLYSLDSAATWSEPVIVEDCGTDECGYPSVVELSGNRLLIVYYASGGTAIVGRIIAFEPRFQ